MKILYIMNTDDFVILKGGNTALLLIHQKQALKKGKKSDTLTEVNVR